MGLTAAEKKIVSEVGFDLELAEFLRDHSVGPIERLREFTGSGFQDAPGLSIAVADGDEAERLMITMCPRLQSKGYRAFWSTRDQGTGLEETNEVAILKTSDPYAMIRLRQTSAENYDVTTDGIIKRLSAWESICDFNVVGAGLDWVAIQFIKVPANICAFAEEVYLFCRDSVVQGTGLETQAENEQRFADARVLCPGIAIKDDTVERFEEQLHRVPPEHAEQLRELMSAAAEHSTPIDMGIRLLALDISRKKYLFLWWD